MWKLNETCLRWQYQLVTINSRHTDNGYLIMYQEITITFKKNIVIDKKYILRKMNLKFQNPKFNILLSIIIFCVIKCKSWGLIGSWGHSGANKKIWMELQASIFWETETIHRISSRNNKAFTWILFAIKCITLSSTKVFFTITSWTTSLSVKSVEGITLSEIIPGTYDLSDLLLFFFSRHCVKSVQIWSYLWSVFSCIQYKYRKIWTRNKSVFGHFSRSGVFVRFGAASCFVVI